MLLFAAPLLLTGQRAVADLPFELYGDHILLKANVNGRLVNALFDTGAGATIVDTALARASGARRDVGTTVDAEGAGEGKVAAQAVKNLALGFPGTAVRQRVEVVVPLAALSRLAGKPLQAIVGADLIARYRVEIDYAKGHIRLFDPRFAAVPDGATVLPVELVGGLPRVRGSVMVSDLGPQPVTMMLDTGSGSGFEFTDRAVVRLGLDKRYASVPEVVTGAGAAGKTRGREVRLPWAAIGRTRLDRPTAILASDVGGVIGEDAAYDVLVGGKALRRFTLTLDYAHRRLFLQPNAHLADPFDGDRTGLGLAPGKDGYEVERLVPGSPAAEAGIAEGDVVVRIQGQALGLPPAVQHLLNTATGTLRLTVRHDGQVREVRVETRELLP